MASRRERWVTSRMSWPSMKMAPFLTSAKRRRSLVRVDLPEPETPTRPRLVPGMTVRLKSSNSLSFCSSWVKEMWLNSRRASVTCNGRSVLSSTMKGRSRISTMVLASPKQRLKTRRMWLICHMLCESEEEREKRKRTFAMLRPNQSWLMMSRKIISTRAIMRMMFKMRLRLKDALARPKVAWRVRAVALAKRFFS